MEKDPDGLDQHESGAKLDANKMALFTHLINYFPGALVEVCDVSEYGARKYTTDGWKTVKDGRRRYTDAMARHLFAETIELYDTESEKLHAAHLAWNALARLQLMLEEISESENLSTDS